MAKASHSLSPEMHGNSAIAAAAAEIHALINGKPWSPTKDELAATIRRHVTPMALPDPDFGVPSKLRAEWERLADEMRVAAARCDAVAEAEGGYSSATCAAEDAAVKTQDQLNECAERIVNEPVRSQADLMLLAEATHWWLYTEPSGLWALKAEAQLAGHPPHVISGIVEEAVLALLRGVRDVGMRDERGLGGVS